MADGDTELDPKRVSDGSILYQEVLLILQNHGEVAEVIAELRPEREVAALVSIQVHQPVLRIVRHLLIKIAISTNGELLGNVLHRSVLPNEFTAAAKLRRAVGVVRHVLKLGAQFALAAPRQIRKGGRGSRRVVMLPDVYEVVLVVAEAGRVSFEPVPPIQGAFRIRNRGFQDRISNSGLVAPS